MSMTNENHNAEWELGDAITIRLDPWSRTRRDASAENDGRGRRPDLTDA